MGVEVWFQGLGGEAGLIFVWFKEGEENDP